MTGWRMGYGVWPKAVFPAAERLAINCHSCVNAAAQYAGIAALEGPREPVKRMVKAFAERRQAIVAALNSLPGIRCATAGRRLLHLPQHFRHRLRRPRLPERAAGRRPGSRRSPAPALARFGEDYISFSYANSLEAIAEAMERIRRFLGNRPRRAAAEG